MSIDAGEEPSGQNAILPAWARNLRHSGEHPTRWDALRFHAPTSARFDHHLPDDTGEAKLQDRGILMRKIGREDSTMRSR